MKKLIFMSLLPFVMSGCVASMYKTPPNAPIATLELNTSIAPMYVQHFSNEQCEKSINGVRIALLFDGIEGLDSSGKKVSIVANENFVFTFNYSYHGQFVTQNCPITATFFPKEGEFYKAEYYLNDNQCYLELYRKVLKSEQVLYEPETSFKPLGKVCWDSWTG